MPHSRFLVKLFASYALLVAVHAVVTELLVERWSRSEERRETEETLAADAALLVEVARPALLPAPLNGGDLSLQRRLEELGGQTRARLTVIAADGRVLGDSAEPPAMMENHAGRPEIVAAAATGIGSAERVSATTGIRTVYVARAVPGGRPHLGFVRVALPLAGVEGRVERIRGTVLAGSAISAAVALAIAAFVARKLTQPLAAMTVAATALAEGGAVKTIHHDSGDEMGELARAFNRMAARLEERLDQLESERAKLATVLESMAEGMVAVDAEERLVHCNAAARRMLGLPLSGGLARPLVELVRTPELVETLRHAAAERTVRIDELRVHAAARERALSIHAAPLAEGGAVAVLLDVSELRRLETVRRDFVANVSHEIKTPLAAMRGLVETLIDDAAMDPALRQRFLGKLGDQVKRLTELATDLLHLSRAESEESRDRTFVDLGAAAAAACDRFFAAAQAKRIELACEAAPRPVVGLCDPEAVAQVLDNLVDNALKYTPAGGRVRVRTSVRAGRGVHEVVDSGIGIEPAEQVRIFERFYRVDKARSRDVAGTGLGLSIVKHLVEAHQGLVELESWPGRGSTFRVLWPLAPMPVAGASAPGV